MVEKTPSTLSAHRSTSACSTSSTFSPTSGSCVVTPPLSLPFRGWGDGGGRSAGGSSREGRHPQAASGYSGYRPTSDTSSSDYSVHASSGHDCVAGHDDESVTGGGREVTGDQQQRQRWEWFSLPDGFSSAEEETWVSEGEVERSMFAGRRHALIPGIPIGAKNRRGADADHSAIARNGINVGEAEEEEDGEERGLLDQGGLTTTVTVATAEAMRAPSCGGGLDGGGSRRKAAVGAGWATRRACRAARALDGRSAPRDRIRIDSAGDKAREGPGRCCGSGSGGQRPKKVTRSLFIEIENKASEPPQLPRQTAAQKRAAAGRRRRTRNALVAQLQQRPRRRTGHTGGDADDADDEDDDESGTSDDDNVLCGCAQRCFRVVDSWYHALVGGPTKVKFSELDLVADMPPSAAVL